MRRLVHTLVFTSLLCLKQSVDCKPLQFTSLLSYPLPSVPKTRELPDTQGLAVRGGGAWSLGAPCLIPGAGVVGDGDPVRSDGLLHGECRVTIVRD